MVMLLYQGSETCSQNPGESSQKYNLRPHPSLQMTTALLDCLTTELKRPGVRTTQLNYSQISDCHLMYEIK